MYRKLTAYLLLLPLLSVFLLTCSRSVLNNQIHFGIQAAQKNLWDEAVFRWKKVINSNPESAAAHNNLAVAYEKKGLWEQAKKEYETALKLSPKNIYIKANFENFNKNYELQEKDEKDKKN